MSAMHPSLWSASSTNTIKRDSFKSKSSSSGLNSLYTTFNIQDPARQSRHNDDSEDSRHRKPVFTLDSLFGSSQNTSVDDGASIGTDVSSGPDWNFRRSDAYSVGRYSTDKRRRKSEFAYKFNDDPRRHNRYRITSNSQTIHNVSTITSNYHTITTNSVMAGNRNHRSPGSNSSSSSIGTSPVTSVSLPKLQSDFDAENIPEVADSDIFEDFPYDIRSMASMSAESRRRNADNVSLSTNYSGRWSTYVVSYVSYID